MLAFRCSVSTMVVSSPRRMGRLFRFHEFVYANMHHLRMCDMTIIENLKAKA
jgi:hypothetical protein